MIYWDPSTRLMVQGQQMNNPISSSDTTCSSHVAHGDNGAQQQQQ